MGGAWAGGDPPPLLVCPTRRPSSSGPLLLPLRPSQPPLTRCMEEWAWAWLHCLFPLSPPLRPTDWRTAGSLPFLLFGLLFSFSLLFSLRTNLTPPDDRQAGAERQTAAKRAGGRREDGKRGRQQQRERRADALTRCRCDVRRSPAVLLCAALPEAPLRSLLPNTSFFHSLTHTHSHNECQSMPQWRLVPSPRLLVRAPAR